MTDYKRDINVLLLRISPQFCRISYITSERTTQNTPLPTVLIFLSAGRCLAMAVVSFFCFAVVAQKKVLFTQSLINNGSNGRNVKEQSCPNLRYFTCTCMVGLRKTTKNHNHNSRHPELDSNGQPRTQVSGAIVCANLARWKKRL